ncbi:MAG: DUF58 domain-containing protein [Phycisphaeraceae bacterium]|nr:DUF58 domain-containing protein [Phycisphaeraceae bacterium]
MTDTASHIDAPAASDPIDPAALMRIKSLALRAKVVVEGFWRGIHRSPYHGFSVEFTEYRQYSPGDDTRYLDWRLYARSDRYYIKKYEDETNLRCWLVVDRSRSMGFGTIGYTKADYAATLAASISRLLFRQGDAVGLITFDRDIDTYLPPRNRPGHLKHLTAALSKTPDGRATDLSEPLNRVAQIARRRGLMVLVSDLLAPVDRLRRDMGMLRARGHDVMVFQILDPRELDFGFESPTRFEDMETGRQLYVDPVAASTDYRKRLERHLADVRAACGDLGADLFLMDTQTPLDTALLAFLKRRAARSKGAVR